MKARGALLGLAVGDALGTTYEFRALEQPDYPVLATGPATDVVGGGPFDLVAGQVTDDTQLAVCIARSLAERGGFDAADLGRRYIAWSEHAFDIGNQTGAAIRQLEHGDAEAGMTVWRESGRRAAGNGSLMRTAPLAAVLAGDALIDAALAESAITHGDPRCMLACAAFDAAIASGADGRGMIDVARATLPYAAGRLRWAGEDAAHLARAVDELTTDLDAALADSPRVYRAGMHLHQTAGFVRVAFRLAFWHAAHTPSWRDAVVDVASRGGDADTNAAIVGALLGARDGDSAIPSAWIERVLGVTQKGPAEWAEAHHPRHLLALVK